ncbi:RNA ligase (ATP) [Nostoc sp. CHAB 5834]|nr:RNA ligase (ATP) [Nostoc sp. CHAB 5834]
MSKFQVLVSRITEITPHPNASKLEIGRIKDLQVVLPKNQYQVNELVVFLPEQTLVPQWLLVRLGLWNEELGKGKLAGPKGDRVHPVELRGVLSMGLPMPGRYVNEVLEVEGPDGQSHSFEEGKDLAQYLGCTKYMPEPPAEMRGEAFPLDLKLAAKFDVEDVHSHPGVLHPGEEVVVLEKVHGTFTGIAEVSPEDETEYGRRIVVSKGLTDQGLAFIPSEAHDRCLYLKAADILRPEAFAHLRVALGVPTEPIWVLGEAYGSTVQDLTYGVELEFIVFAVALGYRYDLRFVDYDTVHSLIVVQLGLRMPKVLYRGPYELSAIEKACEGTEQVSGRELHICEGGVILPVGERKDSRLDTGRVALKCVSPKYRKRPNGTEYR